MKPAKEQYKHRGPDTVPKTLSFDRETERVLMAMSKGRPSQFIAKLIWKEIGRREAEAERKLNSVVTLAGHGKSQMRLME